MQMKNLILALAVLFAIKAPLALAVEDSDLANKYTYEHESHESETKGTSKTEPKTESNQPDDREMLIQHNVERLRYQAQVDMLSKELQGVSDEFKTTEQKLGAEMKSFAQKKCKTVFQITKRNPKDLKAKECLEIETKINSTRVELETLAKQKNQLQADLADAKGKLQNLGRVEQDTTIKSIEPSDQKMESGHKNRKKKSKSKSRDVDGRPFH